MYRVYTRNWCIYTKCVCIYTQQYVCLYAYCVCIHTFVCVYTLCACIYTYVSCIYTQNVCIYTNCVCTYQAVGLVAYLPYVEVDEGYKTHKNYILAKRHVLQTCINLVVSAIEARAKDGFRCSINNKTMWLFARLGGMSLDTPERVKYFGLRSVTTCGICRRRMGRSATRCATCHCPEQVQQLYADAYIESNTRPSQRKRKRARDQLHRHGLDYAKRCRLMEVAKLCLVHIDKYSPRLLGGLIRYERMHVYYQGYCTYALEVLVRCVSKTNYCFVQDVINSCQQFRDPHTGVTHPRLPYLLKMTHLTAERRCRAIFYWAHVLGLKAYVK